MSSNKLKILCLHGYRQDSVAFRSKIGGFRKMLSSHAEFTFLTAPLKVPNKEPNDGAENEANAQHGWWFSSENWFSAHEQSELSTGFEQSIEAVERIFNQEGPFDGILGFSQGACLAAMLAGLQQQNKLQNCSFKFVIIIAGFLSKSTAHDEIITETIHLPSLHVYGETDGIINKSMSEVLKDRFGNAEVIVHSGGHYVPSGKCKAEYVQFLQKMKKLCLNS